MIRLVHDKTKWPGCRGCVYLVKRACRKPKSKPDCGNGVYRDDRTEKIRCVAVKRGRT